MTESEFKQAFPHLEKLAYKGNEYEVIAVDYDRKEIGLLDTASLDNVKWVKIERITI